MRVDFTHEEVVGNARNLAWGASIVAAFWIFVGQLLAAIFLRRVTRPLVQLSEAAESLVEERGVRLEEPEERELADLVRAFNDMSRRLDERRAENQRLIAELEERVAQKTREVLRADRLATLGGIAAGFAHELGNSLNVIRGYASVAARELPNDAEVKGDVEAIRREVTRAAALMERFLVFARARTVHPIAQPVEPILREAVEVVGPAAAQAKVERIVEIAPDLPEVVADGELLRQAFLNLCVNAVQAMQDRGGGTLVARARPRGRRGRRRGGGQRARHGARRRRARLRSVLHDEGERDRPRARHRAAGGGGARRGGGGRERARARGHLPDPPARGAGGARARRRGRRRDAPEAVVRRARGARMTKPNLMVIDDLDSARQMMKRTLGRSYAVFDFPSVAEALPAVERAEFDAIVTDLRMPGIDGIEGMRRFKAKVPEIPVILVTAFATVETAVEAMKAGRVRLPQEAVRAGGARDRRRARGRARAHQARERAPAGARSPASSACTGSSASPSR